MKLKIKLKTTDWPAAVARDFLLAASNTAPLYGDGEAEGKLVDEDVVLLAKLAKKIHANDGIFFFSPIFTLIIICSISSDAIRNACATFDSGPKQVNVLPIL